MTIELDRLFRVGQHIQQIIPDSRYPQALYRNVLAVHADRVEVNTYGRDDWGTHVFTLDGGTDNVRHLLPPNIGTIPGERRPWPRTTRALVNRLELILESQVLDRAWVTSTAMMREPAEIAHVFVPGWQAPIEHVADLIRAYLPYHPAKVAVEPGPEGFSQTLTVRKVDE